MLFSLRPARSLRGAVLACAVLCVPAAASVARATPVAHSDAGCYATGQPIHLMGAGFTPSGPITTLYPNPDGTIAAATSTADAGGLLDQTFPAPDPGRPRRTLFLSVNDTTLYQQGAEPTDVVALVVVQITQPPKVLSPWSTPGPRARRADPRAKAQFGGLGWVGQGSDLYAHYLRGTRVIKMVHIGTLVAPCGDLGRMMRQFPFRPVRAGTWSVDFSTDPGWPAPQALHIRYNGIVVPKKLAVR
jgi:hypothetical protein